MTETAKKETFKDVFMFVPNLIGYGRIVLLILAVLFMRTHYSISSFAYILSGLLDAFDGHAARTYNQSSRFGAMLDMLTDRCATMALLAMLCVFYPSASFFFQISSIIDISCHWIHMHTSLLQGNASHKFVDGSGNEFMKIYYTNRTVLFCMCMGNELFYSSLYLLHFTGGPLNIFYLLAIVCFPVAIVKSGLALMQGYYACVNLAMVDVEERKKKE